MSPAALRRSAVWQHGTEGSVHQHAHLPWGIGKVGAPTVSTQRYRRAFFHDLLHDQQGKPGLPSTHPLTGVGDPGAVIAQPLGQRLRGAADAVAKACDASHATSCRSPSRQHPSGSLAERVPSSQPQLRRADRLALSTCVPLRSEDLGALVGFRLHRGDHPYQLYKSLSMHVPSLRVG